MTEGAEQNTSRLNGTVTSSTRLVTGSYKRARDPGPSAGDEYMSTLPVWRTTACTPETPTFLGFDHCPTWAGSARTWYTRATMNVETSAAATTTLRTLGMRLLLAALSFTG